MPRKHYFLNLKCYEEDDGSTQLAPHTIADELSRHLYLLRGRKLARSSAMEWGQSYYDIAFLT
eukprot:scaffold14294_cov559-Alexandrium_tamarense.AAC.1